MSEKQPVERPSDQSSEGEVESNDTSSPSVNSEELKNRIALTNVQLHELSKDDAKFFQAVKDNNDKAVESIHAANSKEGLAYLTQAERYLEYGACCGKIIDRNLIICVLHNEAAAYQRIWALDKCSKYIEAAIYNIETSLNNDSEAYALITLTEPTLKPRDYELISSILKRKQILVQYYLQYCAIMSPLKNHVLALNSSLKAVSLMKELFATYYKYYKSYATEQRNNLISYGKKLKLFKQLSNYRQDIQLHGYQNILKRTRWVLKQWRANKNSSAQHEDVQNWVKTYSIGNAMQMQPYIYNEFDITLNFKKEFELEAVIRKVLLFAISYFTVATEIRLIEVDKYPNNEEQKRKSEEFQKSELYHLTSIKIFATFVPYESMFIKHVLHSYSNHYKPDLSIDDVSFNADDQLQDVPQPQPQLQQSISLSQAQSHLQNSQKQNVKISLTSTIIVHPQQFKSQQHGFHNKEQSQSPQFIQSIKFEDHVQPPSFTPLSQQSSYKSNNTNIIQQCMSEPRQHQSNTNQYEREQKADNIKSLNSLQPLQKSKKKDLKVINLHKLTQKPLDYHSGRPQSTRSNTKIGLKPLTPRAAKLDKDTAIRGEYYCREKSVKRKKNPEQCHEKTNGDRTSRSARPKPITQIEMPRLLRGKSKDKEYSRTKNTSKSLKKKKQKHEKNYEQFLDEGYFSRKPIKQKKKSQKIHARSKKRL